MVKKMRKERPDSELVADLNLLRRDMLASRLHPDTFGGYKNKLNGKEVVLLATGPSLSKFKPIENAVYVGVNAAILYKRVTLDYLFMVDYPAVLNYCEEAKDSPVVKFYGIHSSPSLIIPESVAIRHGAKRFYMNGAGFQEEIGKELIPAFDITAQPLVTHGSIVSAAMQFIFYTNPKRIYLVACDCYGNGHHVDDNGNRLGIKNNQSDYSKLINGWMEIKCFAETFYPETEIVSLNPVGLRGLFKDIDQVDE